MTTTQSKPAAPAFTSYKPFIGFMNYFRDELKHIPLKIDKGHLPKASGSVVLGHLHAMRFLKLIDDSGKPLPLFKNFAMASDAERAVVLEGMLKNSYSFMFGDPEFDLSRASGTQVEGKFREQQITGSTVVRAILFFLAAAKDAGIPVSAAVKAPSAPPRAKKPANGKAAAAAPARGEEEEEEEEEPDPAGVMKFEIPIPINRKVKISIPSDFDEADWELLQTMFTAYVTRWKGFKQAGKA